MIKKADIIDYILLIIIFIIVILSGGRCVNPLEKIFVEEIPVAEIPDSFGYSNFQEYVIYDNDITRNSNFEFQYNFYIMNISEYELTNITVNMSTTEGDKTFSIERLAVGERQGLFSFTRTIYSQGQGYSVSNFRAKGEIVDE